MSEIQVDTVAEKTSANGVTVDGLNIKDSKLVTANSVITSNITDANITTAKIADVNVTEGKIADNAITLAKMASGTDGNIISYDASGNPVAIATGNDGQVLTSAGAGQPPAFETAAAGGKVGQVISTQLAVERNTTSTSYVDITGVAVSITPSATSSKVLVQGSILWGRNSNNTMWLKMYRGSTNINGQSFSSADTGTFWASGVDSGYYELRSAPFSFLDSPNTTNAVTYKIQWRSDGNTLYMNRIGADTNQAGTSQINAIEILG